MLKTHQDVRNLCSILRIELKEACREWELSQKRQKITEIVEVAMGEQYFHSEIDIVFNRIMGVLNDK